jgi:hypothetical protein
MCRKMLAARSDRITRPHRAQSLSGGQWWQAPPCELHPSDRTGRVVRKETTHPLVSFDKTGSRTLGSFDSRAGKAEFGGFPQGNGRSECCGLKEGGCWMRDAGSLGSDCSLHPTSAASYAARFCATSELASVARCCSSLAWNIALGRMWPSSVTSSKRTETRLETPDSSIVTP